jgi:quinoprotein glucose dehydrogenase
MAGAVICLLFLALNPQGMNVDWANVGNDKGAMRYSGLNQINWKTVKKLKVSWTYHSGEEAKSGSTIESTPIVIDGVMYLTTVKLKVVALDAGTGHEIWTYDPFSNGITAAGVNRGVAYWSDEKQDGARRIIYSTNDGRLISLDAKNGKPDENFGTNGFVYLRAGIERDISKMQYGSTSAPAIYKDLAIIPIINSESQPGAPGDIRAFNVRTGEEMWRFHTVPQPSEIGAETWSQDGWKDRTGVNAWSGYSIDTKRGIVYAGLGSASSDFYGADRLGSNLFANCTVALNARTGERLWHFQTVHHDLWDHDNPCPPVVCSIIRDGKKVAVVAQPTKTGFVFVFDRLTGKPLYDVKEVAAQPSDIPGEQAWSTQPVPVLPPALEPQMVSENELTNISPRAHAYAVEQIKKYRHDAAYLPPSLQGSLISPGFHGGANWSGASVDPTTNYLYINTNNYPFLCSINPNPLGGYDFGGYKYFSDQDGYPAVKPPWGHLTAIDLNTGKFVWRTTLGEYPALKAKKVPPTGTQSFGGTIVTAGGLVFIGGSMDEKFHAFNKRTGQLLWEYQLPAGGYATPSTYMVNDKQFVVIAAGGGGKLGTKSGDSFIAFALP